MTLGETQQFKDGMEALASLRQRLGAIPELKAIALLLLFMERAEVPTGQFPPFAGLGTELDAQVVQAYREELSRVVAGEDDDE